MSRVGKLPDDFEGSLDANGSTKGTLLDRSRQLGEQDTFAEQSANPNMLQSLSTDSLMPTTIEDITAMFEKTPLFMNSLDNAADDGGLSLAICLDAC